MQKKYEFTGETMLIGNSIGEKTIVKEIVSLINIENHNVKAGDKGGWIESDKNLSHSGSAWVSADSFVMDDAAVNGHGYIESTTLRERAIVGNQAIIRNSTLAGEAKVHDSAQVINSHLDGDTLIGEQSIVSNCFLTNVRVERPATLDADSSTIESREPLVISKNLTISASTLELYGGRVLATAILEKVTATEECVLELETKTVVKQADIQNAGIHTMDSTDQQQVVNIVGNERISVKNGVFILENSSLLGNVELDGGENTPSPLRLTDSTLNDFSKIKRTKPDERFVLERLNMSEFSKLELEAFLNKTRVSDYTLSGDDKVSH